MSFGNFRDGLSGMAGKMSQLQRRLSQGMMQDDEVNRDQPVLQGSNASSPNPPGSQGFTTSGTLTNTGSQQNQNSMFNSGSAQYNAASMRDRPNMSLNLNSTSPSGGSSSTIGPGGPNPSSTGPPGPAYQQRQQPPPQSSQAQQLPKQHQQQEEPQRSLPKTISAPSSPTKTYTPANIARSIFRQVSQSTTNLVQQTVAGVSGGPREKAKILLVIDDQHTDWSKYFRGRRIQNEYDIRIEQAEFTEINMAAFSDRGTMVDMEVTRSGTKVVRSFRPDFVLIRQPIRDASRDYRHLLLALMYGNVPSVNSLDSLLMFLDKPLIFSQLIQIQQRLGRDKFPLIQQSFYPNHREMLSSSTFPVVCKIGHAHCGMGKTRVDNHYDFQDTASLVGSCSAYCSVEPFIDSKYDLHIQKIGPSYKAFIRKSISGSWKANIGSSMLEQVPLQEKHRAWLDECSRLCGGLDIFAIEAVVSKDGQEFIIGMNDSSAMGLLGETQEEDRQTIAEIVFRKMDADANRRRLSSVQSSAGSADQQRGPSQSVNPSSAPQVPNGYACGGPQRRGSRETSGPADSGVNAVRERDQSVPNYAQRGMGERTSGPPMGPPGTVFSRDVTGRDPPARDPRDSNIRDVSGMRDSGPPGMRDFHNPSREPPTREGSTTSGRFRDQSSSDSRTSTFTGAQPPGANSAGFGPQAYGGSGGPAQQPPLGGRTMSMSRATPGGQTGSTAGPADGSGGSGSNRGSLSQQGQAGSAGQTNAPRQPGQTSDSEDTMANLKKTFAGIFSDM